MRKWFNQQKESVDSDIDMLKWSTQLTMNAKGSNSAVQHFLVNVMKELISKELIQRRILH